MSDQILSLFLNWSTRQGRWPALLLLGIPAAFVFTQLYYELSFRDTFEHWTFWAGTGISLIATSVAFFAATLVVPQKRGYLILVLIMLAAGTLVTTGAYDRRQQVEAMDVVETYHDTIVDVLDRLVPGVLNGEDKAQVLLGEFYAKGMLGEPRFDIARVLYEQSAKQQNARASVNLHLMYREGLGVKKNEALAKYWQIHAAGLSTTEKLSAEVLQFSGVDQEIVDELVLLGLVEQNEADQITVRPLLIELIEPPLASFRGQRVAEFSVEIPQGVRERVIVGRVTPAERVVVLTVNDQPVEPISDGIFHTTVAVASGGTPVRIVAVDKGGESARFEFSLVSATSVPPTSTRPSEQLSEYEVQLRTAVAEFAPKAYRALVIGNNDYQYLPKLRSAVNDAKAISEMLRSQYGFEVTTLLNTTRHQILQALNAFRERLIEDDAFLIYYAGHGALDDINQRGHWLPVDAERDSSANWISNVAITDILNLISARHLMVLADSCYSGALTRAAVAQLPGGMSDEQRVKWLERVSRTRSRTVMTSGGLEPVLDSGSGAHSVFAQAILDVLRANEGVLEGHRFFRQVQARLVFASNRLQIEQVPTYAPIAYAGHEAGDFLFIPAALR